MTTKTLGQIRAEYTPERLAGIAAKARSFNDETTDDDIAGGRVRRVGGRGFAQFKQYINRNGRPKSQMRKVKVSIMLPETYVASMRGVKGYSRMLGDYIVRGIQNEKISFPMAAN